MKSAIAATLAASLLLVGCDSRPGPPGQTGAQGQQGPQGATGPIGPQGVQGAQGPQGPQGAQGPMGERGAAGPSGEKGERGEKGDRGERGERGEKGDRGDTGGRGERGEGLRLVRHEGCGDECRVSCERGEAMVNAYCHVARGSNGVAIIMKYHYPNDANGDLVASCASGAGGGIVAICARP